MKAFLVGVAFLAGCGEVIQNQGSSQGETCTTGTDCTSGNCVDGVCCDTACSGTCQACAAAKTGGANGQCLPVTAGTDPDTECGSTSCTAAGVTKSSCGGADACMETSTSCGNYTCDPASVSCRTTCADNGSCISTMFCNSAKTCAKRLRVALQTNATSMTRTEAMANVKAALEARGHSATIVEGIQIDEAAELANFDVVVTGGFGTSTTDERPQYDAVLGPWVKAGGGLVGSGWVVYVAGPANFAALMPTAGSAYYTVPQNETPVTTHPIGAGLAPFSSVANYLPYGGTPKAGADPILIDASTTPTAFAWAQDSGRVVFVGLLYLDLYMSYNNKALTDGTVPDALEFLLRSIEWAGRSL